MAITDLLSSAASALDKTRSAASSTFDKARSLSSSAFGKTRSAASSTFDKAKKAVSGITSKGASAIASSTAGDSMPAVTSVTAPISGFFASIPSYGRWFWKGLTLDPLASSLQTGVAWTFFMIPILVLAIYFIYKNISSLPTPMKAAATSDTIAAPLNAAASRAKEGFRTDTLFVNTQPASIATAGLVSATSFDAQTAVTNALKSGFRALTLQIDHMDSSKAGFPDPGVPILIKRTDGALVSTNYAEISDVAKAIAAAAFRSDVPNNTEPVIVYLHIVRAPSPVSESEKYKSYLTAIATALQPIAPFHLGITPLGNFTRQLQESNLLETPLSALEGKVIVLCNIDTSIFKGDTSLTKPANDLDYWVNMRVQEGGVASTVNLTDILALSQSESDAFALKGKNRFVIAMSTTNPSVSELTRAVSLGINMVPIDIFVETPENAKSLFNVYGYQSWKAKPQALSSA